MATRWSWLLVLHSGAAVDITVACPEWVDGELEAWFDSASPGGEPADRIVLKPRATLSLSGPTVLALRSRATQRDQ